MFFAFSLKLNLRRTPKTGEPRPPSIFLSPKGSSPWLPMSRNPRSAFPKALLGVADQSRSRSSPIRLGDRPSQCSLFAKGDRFSGDGEVADTDRRRWWLGYPPTAAVVVPKTISARVCRRVFLLTTAEAHAPDTYFMTLRLEAIWPVRDPHQWALFVINCSYREP